MLFLEAAQYFVGDFSPPSYYGFIWLFTFLLLSVGIWMKRKWLDGVIAARVFVIYSGWWFVTKFQALYARFVVSEASASGHRLPLRVRLL